MAKMPPSENDDIKPRNKRQYDSGERRTAEEPARGVPRKPTRTPADDEDWDYDEEDLDLQLDDDDLDMQFDDDDVVEEDDDDDLQ